MKKLGKRKRDKKKKRNTNAKNCVSKLHGAHYFLFRQVYLTMFSVKGRMSTFQPMDTFPFQSYNLL